MKHTVLVFLLPRASFKADKDRMLQDLEMSKYLQWFGLKLV